MTMTVYRHALQMQVGEGLKLRRTHSRVQNMLTIEEGKILLEVLMAVVVEVVVTVSVVVIRILILLLLREMQLHLQHFIAVVKVEMDVQL